MNVYELAKLYYPRLWDKARIQALAAAGKLTEEETAALLNPTDSQEE